MTIRPIRRLNPWSWGRPEERELPTMGPELPAGVSRHKGRAAVTWGAGLFHIIEIGLPPRTLCGAAVGRRLVEYSLWPQGPRARAPYMCAFCHLAFMRSISQGLDCPRGHGPMVLDTEGEEFFCLFCGERRYPSSQGCWSAAARIKHSRRKRKAATECLEPFQPRLFDMGEQLERDAA